MTMREPWPLARLDELPIQLLDGDRSKNYIKRDELVPSGVPFFNSSCFQDGRVAESELSFAPRDKAARIKKGRALEGDIVLTTRGTLGKVVRVPSHLAGAIINAQMLIFRADGVRVDQAFLFQAMRSELFQSALLSFSSGSAQPQIPMRDLRAVAVPLPPLPTQKRIAAILSAYDDLIEVNTRRIAILEEMARRIYEAAEVRFHGEMIELPSVAETTYGHPFKSKQFSEEPVGLGVIRIRDVKKHRASAYTEELGKPHHMVQPMDILIGMDGEFHMSIWAGQDAWLNQRVARLRPLKSPGWPVGLLLEAVRKPIQHLNNTIVGTTVAHLSAKDLKTLRVPNFGQPELASLSASLEPAASLLVTLRKQNANLRAQRDLLLPRLVSGKLDVSEIDLPQKVLTHA